MPFNYIDKIETHKHLILVYDDIKKGREVEFHFIKRGLENKERCIYLTHDDPKLIEYQMRKFGIDIEYYKKKSLLQVSSMPYDIANPENILASMQNILKTLLADKKTPFRIVGRAIQDVGFETAMSVELYLEKTLYNMFDDLNGSILCTYDLAQIKSNNQWMDWLDKLESYHHASLITTYDQNLVKVNPALKFNTK
jgi:hypothetical protein